MLSVALAAPDLSFAENLEAHKKREQARELFEPIHFHFMEIAALLLNQ